jgi:hypothetical protein
VPNARLAYAVDRPSDGSAFIYSVGDLVSYVVLAAWMLAILAAFGMFWGFRGWVRRRHAYRHPRKAGTRPVGRARDPRALRGSPSLDFRDWKEAEAWREGPMKELLDKLSKLEEREAKPEAQHPPRREWDEKPRRGTC